MATDAGALIMGLLQGAGLGRTVGDNQSQQAQVANTQVNNELGQQKLIDAHRAQAEDEAFQADAAAYSQNPTIDALGQLAAKHPAHAEALKHAYSLMSEPARTSRLGQLGELYAAAGNNRPELVAKKINQLKAAESRAGIDTTGYDDLSASIASRDPDAMNLVRGYAQAHMAAADPAKFPTVWSAIGADDRQTQLQPARLARAESDAETAAAEAAAAPGYYADRARKEDAQADISETDSAWRVAKNSAAVASSRAQAAHLYSLIKSEATRQSTSPGKVSVGSIMAPIYAKVAQGTPLSPGENAAWTAYTHAPKGTRAAPAVAGGGSAGVAAAPAAQHVAVNPKTGQRLVWDSKRGWVAAR